MSILSSLPIEMPAQDSFCDLLVIIAEMFDMQSLQRLLGLNISML